VIVDSSYNKPRFPGYVVVDAHTDKVISVHLTRREANACKTKYSHRVRGTADVQVLKRLFKKKAKR